MLIKAGALCCSALMVLAVAAAQPAAAAGPRGGGNQKVTVCQERRDGTLVVRNVAAAAAARGRWIRPGAPHPGVAGAVVGADCAPEPVDIDGDGVADEADNCVIVPNPDQRDSYGSPAGDMCEDSNADGVADVAEPHFCLSVDGTMIRSQGTATCTTTAGPAGSNTAMAHGPGARATATAGSGNVADADGAGARATAQLGDGNHAAAHGDGAAAVAHLGDRNRATAMAHRAGAFAGNGHRNTAIARSQCAAIATGADDQLAECGSA